MLSLSQPLVLTLDGAPLIFEAFMNRRENHTYRFVLKWSVKFNVCWTVFFRSMNKTKKPAKETPAFLILARKRKNLLLEGFLYLIVWSSEEGLGVKEERNFTLVSLKNLWAFIVPIYSMFFLMENSYSSQIFLP